MLHVFYGTVVTKQVQYYHPQKSCLFLHRPLFRSSPMVMNFG